MNRLKEETTANESIDLKKVYKILQDSRWSSDMINCTSKEGYNDMSYPICSFAMRPCHSLIKSRNLGALRMDLGWSCDLF